MAINTVGQSPIIVNTMAERDSLLTLYPDLEEMTQCLVLNGTTGIESYRLHSGIWGQTYPDPNTVDAIAAKASQTQVTNLSNALDTLNSSFQNYQPLWANILNKPNFHAVATSGSYADLNNKPTIPTITIGGAITNSATNAPTDAPTNYGLLAAVLGAEVNANNTKQNQTATNLNALAVKFNTLLTTLRANGIIAP